MTKPQKVLTDSAEKKTTGRWKRWLLRLTMVAGLLGIGIVGFGWYAYRSAQVIPEYYERLLEQPIEDLMVAGDEFETEVLELQNVAIETGEWEAAFSQDQINGWLASDLPEKFPKSLPSSISNPRVALGDDELKLVFQFETKGFRGVVEACGDAYCTQELNQIAIKIKHIRSGVVSMPVAAWTDRISKVMRRNDCPVQWTEENGETIALVGMPRKLSDHPQQKRIIESVEVLDNRLVLKGVTLDPGDLDAYRAARQEDLPNRMEQR